MNCLNTVSEAAEENKEIIRYTYKTHGTCSTHIELELEGDIIKDVAFWNGCNGNLQGISRLVKGMKISEVVARLSGIHCGSRATSCPDQFSKALQEIAEKYSLGL